MSGTAQTSAASKGGPLHGVRILDLSRLLPGGFCTLLLSDLGADVIKIEQPGAGDYIRQMAPFHGDFSAGHVAINRGKRSVALDLKHPDGASAFAELAADADVVVDSFRPGVLDRLGLAYPTLAARNPGLVMCAISGFGQDGPARLRAGHDLNYMAWAGVLGLFGEADGEPVAPPVQMADNAAGTLAAVGILAALMERQVTGLGRLVDVSLTDTAFSWLSAHAYCYAATGELPQRGRMPLSGALACYRTYRCADGRHLAVAALEHRFWATLCEHVGQPELSDLHLAGPSEQRHAAAVLTDVFASRPRDAWVAELHGVDVCVSPVNDMAEAFADPQLNARGMVSAVDTPAGPLAAVASPIALAGRARSSRLPGPPQLGEHTRSILLDAGIDGSRLDEMLVAGAAAETATPQPLKESA